MIPNQTNYNYTNHDENKDYLLLSTGLEKNKYLLVSVETTEETLIELISTIYCLQDHVIINPYTPQILIANPYKEFTLAFPSNKKEMVNIISIDGFAEVHWTSNPKNVYYIRGRDDILSITTEDTDKTPVLQFDFLKKENANCVFYVDSECGFHTHIAFNGITPDDAMWLELKLAMDEDERNEVTELALYTDPTADEYEPIDYSNRYASSEYLEKLS
mgnify:CR=1 FL=1